jgi:hypothetical protein
MTNAISGTIVSVEVTGEGAILLLATGSNGNQREDNVVLPKASRALTEGKAVRLLNFVRNENGALVPGENARVQIQSRAVETDQPVIAKSQHAPAQNSKQEPEPTVESSPTPEPAKLAIAPHPVGIMTFSDKTTRKAVFNRAVQVAREFAEHIRKSGQIIKIQGRDYVTVAGWSLLPAFESANCYTVAHQIEADGTIIVEAIVEKDGRMVSRGFGACSEKERPKINDRLAMAQTRARGSALKARYSVLVTLAGYEASLADEVDAAITVWPTASSPTREPIAPPQKTSQSQIDFALKIFDHDKSAILREAAELGFLTFQIEDIPVAILKAIVERRVNERKNARATAAARVAA